MGWTTGIRVPDFSLRHRLQTVSASHPACYTMGTVGIKRPEGEADHYPLSSAERYGGKVRVYSCIMRGNTLKQAKTDSFQTFYSHLLLSSSNTIWCCVYSTAQTGCFKVWNQSSRIV